jgi:phage gpG-like protein
VEIGSDLPYAQVQNDGGYIKVFGKARVKLPKRQFIGESQELMDYLEKILIKRIDNLTNI